MSSIHLARQGFITKAALPNVTRQRGTTSGESNLMLYGAGKTTVSNNTTFVDSSTNNFTVTRNGDTVQSGFNPFSGVSNGSGFFDGTGDSLSVADNAALELGSNQFCIEGWCYPTSSTGFGVLITKRTNSVTSGDWLIYRNSGSYGLVFSASPNGSTWDIVNNVSFGTMTPNAWNHFAVYRVANAWYGAVNGTVTVLNASNSSAIPNSANPVTIGADTNANSLAGYLSNVRIVNGSSVYTSANFTPPTSALTAITNTSLLLLMENYSVVNSTSTNRLVTLFGNTTISTAQFPTGMNRSIFFDGNGDYLTIPDNTDFNMGTSSFTIECYIYLSSAPGTFATIINKDGKNAVSWPQYALYVNNNYRVNFSLSSVPNTTPSPTVLITGATTLALNTWYHVAATRSGTSATIWVNGVSDGTSSSVPSTLNNGARPLYVGWEDRTTPDTAFNFPGYISNLRLVKGAAVYTANFTAPSAPLPLNISVPAFVTNSIYGVYQLA